jgi:predicted esterase
MGADCRRRAHDDVIRIAAVGCSSIAVALQLVTWTPAATAPDLTVRFRGPFGSGADAAWLLEPSTRPTSVVVFLHGWKLAPPSPSYPWVGQFRPWLDHLVSGGSVVLFAAYQRGGDAQGPVRVESLRHGLEQGFRHLPRLRLPVIVAGYSYGASLAFYYAALAGRWHLPAVGAVDSIFPAEPIPGAALPPLSRSVRVLIQVGDRDSVAGRGGAEAFWSWLATPPGLSRQLVVVHSSPGFEALHASPKLSTPQARRAFWTPLDGLIDAARRHFNSH